MRLHVKIAAALVTAGVAAAPAPAKSPGTSYFNNLTIGPGGIGTFDWQINDAGPSFTFPNAPGVAGGGAGNPVSGWSLIASEVLTNPVTGAISNGNLIWTATSTPGSQFDLQLETLLGPTTPVGTTIDGPMSDFDPTIRPYAWPLITWQGTYTGPTDTRTLSADTLIDPTLFANSVSDVDGLAGVFTIQYDGANNSIDLVFAVPEPGTLGLVGIAGLIVLRRAVRGRRNNLPGRG